MLSYTAERISVRREFLYVSLKIVFSDRHIPTANKTYSLLYDVYDALYSSMVGDFKFFVERGFLSRDRNGYYLTDKLFVKNINTFLIKNHSLKNGLRKIVDGVNK